MFNIFLVSILSLFNTGMNKKQVGELAIRTPCREGVRIALRLLNFALSHSSTAKHKSHTPACNRQQQPPTLFSAGVMYCSLQSFSTNACVASWRRVYNVQRIGIVQFPR